MYCKELITTHARALLAMILLAACTGQPTHISILILSFDRATSGLTHTRQWAPSGSIRRRCRRPISRRVFTRSTARRSSIARRGHTAGWRHNRAVTAMGRSLACLRVILDWQPRAILRRR